MAKLVHSVRLSIPHVDRVRTPCTIQRPDPRADRARPQRLTTIALAGWGAGVLLTVGLARMYGAPLDVKGLSMSAALGQLRPGDAELEPLALAMAKQAPPSRDRAPIAQPATQSQARPVHQTRAPQALDVASAGQATLPDAKPPAIKTEAASAAPAPARRRTKRVFEPGIVAYIRCGGAGPARSACLRDRKFEEQVWLTLAKLPACSEGDPGTGSVELRWTMSKPAESAFDWRPGVDGATLNVRAMAKCAGEKLASTRTRLRAQQAVVSFRFSLK